MGMDFAGAKTRVRNLLAPTKPADLSASALAPDPLRDRIIRDAGQASDRFKTAKRKRPDVEYEREHEDGSKTTEKFEWTTYGEAVEDVARAAFGWDEPDVLSRDKVRGSHRLNREVVDATVHSPHFQELRPYSRNNEPEALYGAMAAAESMRESAEDLLAEHVARSEQIGEAEREQQTADDLFENLRKQAKQDVADHGAVQPGTRRDIKGALKAQDAAAATVANLMQQQNQSSMRVDAIAAGEAAAKAAAEAAQAVSDLPGTHAGDAKNLPIDEQIALAEKWNKHEQLRQVVRRLGRLFQSFSFKRDARTNHVKIQPVGIETGNDLARLLPQEAARGFSTNKLLQATFLRDFSERRLLQYKMEGKSPAGKGPIVLVRDGSGSMGADFGGCSRNVWACSLGLAVQARAHREKRAFVGIEFGSAGQVRAWYFPKNEPVDTEHVLDYATHFFGGGTSTKGGMAEALRIIKQEDAFTTADIVLAADGADQFGAADKKVRDDLRELGVRTTGISIAKPNNLYMQQMCDEVIDMASLADEDAATTALANSLT